MVQPGPHTVELLYSSIDEPVQMDWGNDEHVRWYMYDRPQGLPFPGAVRRAVAVTLAPDTTLEFTRDTDGVWRQSPATS